ncbi:MAG: hypothetical protein WBM02_08820 [bacterium]
MSGLIFSIASRGAAPTPTPTLSEPYSVDHVEFGSPEHHWQWMCYYQHHHFLTLSEFDDGRVVLRPHPGCDPNGWGSSLYLMPFTSLPFHNGSGSVTVFFDHIEVHIIGNISDGTASGFGKFTAVLMLTYDPESKIIEGSGDYEIICHLGTPTPLPDHLKLYLIHSNYLCNVPLQSGGIGDTGDTSDIQFQVQGYPLQSWHPPSGSGHYPLDFGDWIDVNAPANYNEVDNTRQGQCTPTPNYTPSMIDAAYKPSMEVRIFAQSGSTGLNLGFAGNYAQEPEDSCKQVDDPCCPCKQFWSDNLGIHPMVYTNSPSIPQTLSYAITFVSRAHDNDPACTPTPSYPLGVRLHMPDIVHPGDEFSIIGNLDNPDAPLTKVPTFFILEVYGKFWFWPSWVYFDYPKHAEIDYVSFDVPTGTTSITVIQPFNWPDTGQDVVTGLGFYGAMLNPEMSDILGEPAFKEWGYGP